MTGLWKNFQPWIAAGVALVALVLVLGLSLIGWALTGAGSEHLASWIEATATALALIAASIAAVFAAGAFTLERDRETQWLETQRRAQAALVACWFGSLRNEQRDYKGTVAGWTVRAGIWVRNASDTPVAQLRFKVFLDGDLIGMVSHEILPPAPDPTFIRLPDDLAYELISRLPEMLEVIPGMLVEMEFRDSAGVWWRRTVQGWLEEVYLGHH